MNFDFISNNLFSVPGLFWGMASFLVFGCFIFTGCVVALLTWLGFRVT